VFRPLPGPRCGVGGTDRHESVSAGVSGGREPSATVIRAGHDPSADAPGNGPLLSGPGARGAQGEQAHTPTGNGAILVQAASRATRQPIRLHLRATFVTLSLAAGKSEAWVCDRTGHRSSQMVSRYRRAARSVKELDLVQLTPLDRAPQTSHLTRNPRAPSSAG
jgi:hypothetical protein